MNRRLFCQLITRRLVLNRIQSLRKQASQTAARLRTKAPKLIESACKAQGYTPGRSPEAMVHAQLPSLVSRLIQKDSMAHSIQGS